MVSHGTEVIIWIVAAVIVVGIFGAMLITKIRG